MSRLISEHRLLPASIQYQATIGQPAKRHLNSDALAGRWWPAFRCPQAKVVICVLKVKVVRVGIVYYLLLLFDP